MYFFKWHKHFKKKKKNHVKFMFSAFNAYWKRFLFVYFTNVLNVVNSINNFVPYRSIIAYHNFTGVKLGHVIN